MDWYQDVFFRTLDALRGRRTIERLHYLRKSQHWDRAQLEVWQLARLNDLLLQAKKHSPFHAARLSVIELPLTSLKQLESLPILTKNDIRLNQQTIKCSNIPAERFVESRTGGSTGEPTVYFWDKKGMDWNRASVYRAAEWGNTRLGERTVQMSGSHFDYTQSQRLQNKIVYFLQRYRDYPVGFLTKEILENYYQNFMRFKPSSIWGYASGVAIFADYIKQHHSQDDFSFLRAIMTSSEKLWPHQRALINDVFQGEKVFDQYGSRELYIASECSVHQGYHVHGEVVIVEIVRADGRQCEPGELGKVVITDLSNHAFPFIRYEIGDLGILEHPQQCQCGKHLPKLRSIEGRIADVITLSDRVLTPPNFTIIFSDIRGVKAFQIRQDALDQLDILIVPDENYSDASNDYIKSSIEKMVDGKASVNVHLVNDIEVPESGKRRFVVSTVSSQHF